MLMQRFSVLDPFVDLTEICSETLGKGRFKGIFFQKMFKCWTWNINYVCYLSSTSAKE